MRIVQGLESNNMEFTLTKDATGRVGFNPVQKATIATRIIAYNRAADSLDENMEVGESTALRFLKHFCAEVVMKFGSEYLRRLGTAEIIELLEENAGRGWPGLIGSLDWMHWKWLTCPVARTRTYKGKADGRTLVLEAVCDKRLGVLHWNFRRPGANNDLNILQKSHLLDEFIAGV